MILKASANSVACFASRLVILFSVADTAATRMSAAMRAVLSMMTLQCDELVGRERLTRRLTFDLTGCVAVRLKEWLGVSCLETK